MASAFLRVLGVPELRVDGAPAGAVRTRDLVVLTYVLMSRRGHARRDELAAVFWQHSDAARSRASLRQTLYRLRGAVGSMVGGSAEEVLVVPDAVSVDALLFEGDLDAGRIADALDRWSGEFLQGTEDAGAADYRLWLEATRERLRVRREAAFRTLVESLTAAGSLDEALARAEQWQRTTSFSAEPVLHVCELLRRYGRGAEAEARLREAEVHLRDAGLTMSAEVEATWARLKAALRDPALPASAALLSPELTGRSGEMEKLRVGWQRALEGCGRPICVEGEEGAGKSRLCNEFLRGLSRSEEPPLVLASRARPTDSPGGPSAPDPASRDAALGRLLAPVRTAPGLSGASARALAEVARLVPALRNRFSDLPEARGTPSVMVESIREVLAAVAAEAPVVLFMDDLQFLDGADRSLLDELGKRLPARIMLLATSQIAPSSSNGDGHHSPSDGDWIRLRLAPLSRSDCRSLISSMLELRPEDLESLTDRLYDESRGNPFFVTELVTELVDDGRLQTGPDGVWRIEGSSGPLPVPSDLRGLLLRRLAQLGPAARRLLAAGTDLEPPFAAERLFGAAGMGGVEAASALHELLSRRLLHESPGGLGYELRHGAVRRVLMETLSPMPASGPQPGVRNARRRWMLIAAAAAVVILAVTAGARVLGRSAPAPTIAVFRLDNLSADSADAYLSAGLADELASRLGQLQHLRVLSPSALEGLRPAGQDRWSAARRLGAAYAVEGSVRRSGEVVRVALRLTGTSDGVQTWSATYDLTGERLLEVEASVAVDLAREVRARLAPADRLALERGPTDDPAAFDHFLRANHALARRTPESVARAVVEYAAAQRLDPSFAAARAREAYALSVMIDWGWPYHGLDADSLLPRALAIADDAIHIDSTSPDAWLARAYLRVLKDPIQATGALSAFERAIALDPGSAEAFHQYGQTLMSMGRFDEAERAYRHALELEPSRAMVLVPLAGIALRRGDVRAALALSDSAVAADPSVPYAYTGRASFRLQTGDPTGARADAEAALRIGPDYGLPALAILAAARARLGDRAGAREALGQALARADTARPSSTDAYYLGVALIEVGDTAKALDLLERTRPQSAWTWYYTQSPQYDAVRESARYRALMHDVHIGSD